MITKIKEVYYCEYCKKRYLAKWAIENHERRCTLNPKRECKLCGQGDLTKIIEKYKNSYKIYSEKPFKGFKNVWKQTTLETDIYWIKEFTLNDIRDDVDYCPNCLLTILRCSGLINYPMRLKLDLDNELEFNYKKELQEWWHEHNVDNGGLCDDIY